MLSRHDALRATRCLENWRALHLERNWESAMDARLAAQMGLSMELTRGSALRPWERNWAPSWARRTVMCLGQAMVGSWEGPSASMTGKWSGQRLVPMWAKLRDLALARNWAPAMVTSSG